MKKKNILIVLGIITLICIKSVGQVYTIYGDKTFGSDRIDLYPTIVKVDSSSFIVCGYSSGNISGDKSDSNCTAIANNDIWLLKIDTGFNIIWDKTYGGSNNETQNIPIINNSKQILITSTSASDSSCTKLSHNRSYPMFSQDYWMLSLDSNGNEINQFTFGGTGNDMFPQSVQLNSGNYIICGTSFSPVSGDKTSPNYTNLSGYEDYWIVKTDSAGNKLWDKVYGGIGHEATNGWYNYGFSTLSEKNDAFILAGTTDSPPSNDISDTCRGGIDIWIIKIDSLGNKIWDKRYGGSGGEMCTHIIHSDNGYILCGFTSSSQGGEVSDTSRGLQDCWVVKLDSVGNKIWDKRYGGNSNDNATWIEEAPDGGYWVSGNTESNAGGEVSEPKYASSGFRDYWIFKIDENGNKIWDKRFGGPGDNGGSSFIIMPDSSIFLAGYSMSGTSPVKTDYGKGQRDYWIIHFKYICATSATINPVTCNSYTSPSGNYSWTSSGIYNDTIPNAAGCDSVITVNLTINSTTASAQSVTACDSYTSPSGNNNWTSSGIYNDTIMNAAGCDSVITVNLTINNATSSTQSVTACNSYKSPSGNYNWTNSGIYNDTIQNAGGCDSVITINLIINTVDTSVTANAPFLLSNATGAVYQWMYCDSGLIAGATNQSYNATTNGSYSVIVFQNGCEDTSSCYLVLNVGIDEKENERMLKVYPNPVKDVLIVSLIKPLHSNDLITISDMQGRMVGEKNTNHTQVDNSGVISIDVSALSQGVYLLKVNEDVQRFVKM